MNPSDEDLILYFYGEAENAAEIAAQLMASAAVRERYARIERTLGAADAWPAAEPMTGYGARVWRRIEDRVSAKPRPAVLLPRWAWAAAAVVMAAIGLVWLLGRVAPTAPPTQPSAFSEASRQRILQSALAHHLERAERLLIEIDNGGATLSADLERERAIASEWVEDNRLYRSAAAAGGAESVRPLLDELEPVMLELAHATGTAADVDPLRERVSRTDLLFKVRVSTDRLQHQPESAPEPKRRGAVI